MFRRIPATITSDNRGQNPGGKSFVLQSYKGMQSLKRIKRPSTKLVWGPLGWAFLHNLAISYPINPSEEDINQARSAVEKFIEEMPLRPTCKKFSQDYLNNNPIFLNSNKDFQVWVWIYHNWINYRIGKRYFTLSDYDIKYKQNLSDK